MPKATVDLSALRANLRRLRARLQPGCQLLAAVKADAYGHGAVPTARALSAAGVSWFGVATAEEALELRRAGLDGRILLFGPAYRCLPELIEADVDLTIVDETSLLAVERAAGRRGPRLHLKVDTGMGRLGLPPAEALELARRAAGSNRFELHGVWTHFARADEADPEPSVGQLARFEAFLEALARDGIAPPLVHAANSAALLALDRAHFDLVRPGIALYGYPPSRALAGCEPLLEPVMTLTAPVTFVKRVPGGTAISYGGTWRAPRATTVATLRLGYADGYPRVLGNRAWAVVGGARAEVVGNVCMDQLMLDVGDAAVAPGDRAVLFGRGGPDAAELAALAGTIPYELLTSVSRRVERSYLD